MPAPERSEVDAARLRSQRAWNYRAGWDALYNEAYDYVLPNRKPGGLGANKAVAQKIFDMTAPNSAIHFAGELQRQVFPVSTPFNLEAGPLLASRLPADQLKGMDRLLAQYSASVYPFMKTGDFDTAVHEMCIDLGIGTGALLPLKGPSIEDPIVFISIPQDEIALSTDAWGRVNFVSWRRKNLGREAIVEAWPRGRFTDEFRQAAKEKPYEETTIFQDFRKRLDGSWEFYCYLEKDGDIIERSVTRTQPIAVPRFYRVPGEAYGRGPILFALPTIKTTNKAQELALKAFAIQMLGIWGYRAGGTFNPDTVRVGPGEMWPMQSTGGILGPDVQRLDPASGRVDLARMVIPSQQQQIRDALLDTRLHDDGGTPASASEVALKMRQNGNVHVGAYGRLVRETLPVVVFRTMEILAEWRILPSLLSINELLVSMSVSSPMLQMLKADEFTAVTNYFELANAVAGDRAGRYVNEERFLERGRKALLVPQDVVPTPEEQKKFDEDYAARQAQAVAAEMATRAAPQLVQSLTQEAA